MKFKTHTERMLNPQARLIPQDMWRDFNLFDRELPDVLLPLMQAEEGDIVHTLEQTLQVPISDKEKQCTWLAIALSHPHLRHEFLLEISHALVMSHELIFKTAVTIGYLGFLRHLEDKAPDKLQAMIMANNYDVFILAALMGHPEVLRYLEEKAPDKLQAMIASCNYHSFKMAAQNGHIEVLRYLEEKAPDKLHAMIVRAFGLTIQDGNLDVLHYFESKMLPEQFQALIDFHASHAFSMNVAQGNFEFLSYLESKASPDKLQAMITSNNYDVFRNALVVADLDGLRYLEEKAPDKLQAMIASIAYNNYKIIGDIGLRGNLDSLRYLESKMLPDEFQALIDSHGVRAFTAAITARSSNNLEVTQYLLSHSSIFAFADPHIEECGTQVNLFTTQKMSTLRIQKNVLEQEHPNAVFNVVEPKEAKLLFYILRNLIRRNDPGLRDDVSFLLNIPSVKALVHTAVTPGAPNELLRLALTTNNQGAAELLLNIPAVRQLAEANNYYRAEARGRLDLRSLAQNRESSMTALSQGEQERLQDALLRYQPQIKQEGVDKIMHELRETLESRYAAKPAMLMKNDKGILVPMQWDDFDKLNLPKEEREAAREAAIKLPMQWEAFQQIALNEPAREAGLEAYFQNKDHTAWRYLSKPNPWMHEGASYVYVNPDNHDEKWSTFEEYQPEICLFYLGATDATSAPTESYTLATRLDGFIDELAHIGRAHNWDEQRIKINPAGEPVLDEDANPIMEEYDDLDKDRPSCFSGVKRRLFQSVKGHALFSILTKEMIDEELRDVVRQHFKENIHEGNRACLKAAWDKVIEGEEMEPSDWAILKSLDIPLAKQSHFIDSLQDKYGRQFAAEPEFIAHITKMFNLKSKKDAHMLNFGHLHPEDLFENDLSRAMPGSAGSRGLGLFDKPKKQTPSPGNNDDTSPAPG